MESFFKRFLRQKGSVFLWAFLLVLPPIFILSQAIFSPDIAFLWPDSAASWIRYPTPLSTMTRRYVDQGEFQKDFFIENEKKEQVSIHLKAFRSAELWVNDFPVPLEFSQNWKEGGRGPISPWLKQGANTIRVIVHNPLGPALLWVKVEGLDLPVKTDETWKVRYQTRPYVQAALADDTITNPDSRKFPTPLQSLYRKWVSLLSIFGLSIVVFSAAPLLRKIGKREYLTRIVPLAIFGAWVYLFAEKMVKIDLNIGFDIGYHLEYILFIVKNQRIPMPTEGWSMFHPPFFYFLSAGFLQMIGSLFSWENPFPFLKIIPFLCGIGNVWVSYFLLRLFFQDDRSRILVGILLAGLIPMNIYISAYVGNEPLHAFLIGLSLLACARILRSPEVRCRSMILLGVLLSLALLTKVTAFAVVPVVAIFLLYKLIRVLPSRPGAVVARLGLFLLTLAAIAGWYYARNMIYFGSPFIINWNLPGRVWWQDPGFHTLSYYFGFGQSLQHPYFSGFHSFWDSIYSTFWGDGYLAGEAFLSGRHPFWNYDYMSVVYLLALPATGFLLIGLVQGIRLAFRGKEWNSRVSWAFFVITLYAIFAFFLYGTLKVPVYGQAKAFYLLSAMAPITVFGALGLGVVRDWLASPRLMVVRALFYGWLGTLFTSIYLSFAG
ncbi:MAG: hypothetical protein AMJ94_05490 [Deltaproteobacteria bacterium SM23_61]|nr:MAG: hypothetical protein AMJ94_05490 [Deltaproteobacteria bacterium SM23_61]